jgi:hypothetical protein
MSKILLAIIKINSEFTSNVYYLHDFLKEWGIFQKKQIQYVVPNGALY